MAKVLPPIRLNGVLYRVLRLDGGTRGPRFLLRNDAGDLFGLFARNAEPARFNAVPIRTDMRAENPFGRVEFFATEDGLHLRR